MTEVTLPDRFDRALLYANHECPHCNKPSKLRPKLTLASWIKPEHPILIITLRVMAAVEGEETKIVAVL